MTSLKGKNNKCSILSVLQTAPMGALVAVKKDGSQVSAADLTLMVSAIQHQVAKDGSSGQKWGLYTESSIACLAGVLALLQMGKEPVLLPNVQPEILRDCAGLVSGFMTDVPGLKVAKPLHQISLSSALEGDDTTSFMENSPAGGRLHLFTSGTTGQPDIVSKSLMAVDAELGALEDMFGNLVGSGPVLSTVSHQHIYGLLFRVLWPFVSGRVIIDGLLKYPHEVMTRFKEYPDAYLVSGPAFLKRAAKVLDFAHLPTGRPVIFSSGGPLPEKASLQLLETSHTSPIEVFGSTETGGIASRQLDGENEQAVWKVLPGVQVRVKEGRLEVKSPHLETDQWWTTEDNAEVTKEGGFILKGRADRIAKVEEKRVNLGDVEGFLAKSELVEEAAIVVLENHQGRLGAVILPSEAGWSQLELGGREGLKSDLLSHLGTRFESAALPRFWRFVKNIPVNAQGKRSPDGIASQFEIPDVSPNLPQVLNLQKDQTVATIDIFVPPSLPAFRGHFPDTPVTAGVVQLHWIDQFVRRIFSPSVSAMKMDRIKFSRVLLPGTKCCIHLKWDEERFVASFEISDDNTKFASGRLVYDKGQE